MALILNSPSRANYLAKKWVTRKRDSLLSDGYQCHHFEVKITPWTTYSRFVHSNGNVYEIWRTDNIVRTATNGREHELTIF